MTIITTNAQVLMFDNKEKKVLRKSFFSTYSHSLSKGRLNCKFLHFYCQMHRKYLTKIALRYDAIVNKSNKIDVCEKMAVIKRVL